MKNILWTYRHTVDGCEILHQSINGLSMFIPLFIGFQPSKVVQDVFSIHSTSCRNIRNQCYKVTTCRFDAAKAGVLCKTSATALSWLLPFTSCRAIRWMGESSTTNSARPWHSFSKRDARCALKIKAKASQWSYPEGDG